MHVKKEETKGKKEDIKKSGERSDNNNVRKTGLVVVIALGLLLALIFGKKFLLPGTSTEAALFEAYVQDLYDNADEYIQGFPADLSGVNTVHMKYAIADFDGDKTDELLIYSADSKDISYYDEFTLAEDVVSVAYLALYEVKDDEVVMVHSSNYNNLREMPENLTYLDSGVALFDDNESLFVLDLNGKNLEKREFYDGSSIEFSDYNDPEKKLAEEWYELKENRKEVTAHFQRFNDLSAVNNEKGYTIEKESVTEKVQGLDEFIGGWADINDPKTSFHVAIFDNNGKLSIEIDDGIYVFDAEDIRVENDDLICENGYGITPAGNRYSNCIFRAYNDVTYENNRKFEFIYGGCYRQSFGDYSFSKVAKTHDEFDNYKATHNWYVNQAS